MSSIHGVNVGGNLFDVTDSSNVAPMQLTSFASRAYAKDRAFIMADGLLYRATVDIASGDPIVVNGNCKRTTLDEIISVIETDSDLVAPTEDATTSSADYEIGEQIVRSGILYKVIDTIEEGDTFVIDNNIEIAGTLTEQLKAINAEVALKANAADVPTKAQISNPNLLDNPWFTVNQRGATVISSHAYGADRWQAVGTFAPGSFSGVGASYLIQPHEEDMKALLNGKQLTASILTSDGVIHSGTATYSNSSVISYFEDDTFYCGSGDYSNYTFSITFKIGATIKAIKLELGPVSTLAMDTAPNYATELLKCQRYFLRVPNTGSAYASLGCGSIFSATQANIFIATPARMRAIPSVVLNGNFFMRGGGAIYNISSANVYNYAANGVTLELTSSGMTANYAVELCTNNDTTAYLDFSADL